MAAKNPNAIRLSKRSIDAAEPREERYILWDEELKGFGLRVTPSGTKTFFVRYRVGGGRKGTPKHYVIGRYGPLTPEKARKLAEAALGAVAQGQDPQGERAESRAELTLSELCDLYLAEGCATKKASTLKIDKIRIARHIKPLLGRRRLSEIRTAHIERFMQDVASGKTRDEATPHTRGGKAAASRSVGLIGGIFSFAVRRKLCKESPVVGVQKFKDVSRERFLSAAELGRLGEALVSFEAGGLNPAYVNIIRLLALTGARKNEIATLRADELDLERGLLRLKDSKTGVKVIRLGAAAMELLASFNVQKGFVFPDPKFADEPIRGLDWAWVRIRERAELSDVRLHDLRHSFASFGLASGQSLPLISKLLGNAHLATTSRYAHLADDPLQAAADRISGAVDGAMKGTEATIHDMRRGVS
jgi:integrase